MVNKKMKRLRFVAIFLSVLIVMLPFYSAGVFADLTITRNSGDDRVEGAIDASGDTWHLEVSAKVSGEEVEPDEVKVNGFPFDDCTAAPAGFFNCFYTFSFNRVPEQIYPVEVKLFNDANNVADTASTQLLGDGSAPKVTNVNARQSAANAIVDFVVDEEPANCVGLHRIEFFDTATGSKVKTLHGGELSGKINSQCGANSVSETLTLGGQGTNVTSIKISATDKLNHTANVTSNSFTFDRVGPNIKENTLKVGNFTQFVPAQTIATDISIEVFEDQSSVSLFGTSTQLNMNNESASCVKTNVTNNLFTCVWVKQVNLAQAFSIVARAVDAGGNEQTKTVSSNFVVDNAAPTIVFFGTERVFNQKSIARRVNNTFVAKFNEGQSGISFNDAFADFSALNNVYGNKRAADNCTAVVNGQVSCFWNGINVNVNGNAVLVEAKDRVGNAIGSAVTTAVVLDETAPSFVGDVEVLALAGSAGQQRDFFQSRDILRVTFKVAEPNGLIAKADLADIVSNGGTVTAACAAAAGATNSTVTCTFTTPQILSGYDADARIKLIAEDTAGNKAEKTVSIEILGTDTESSPDFWSKGNVQCSPNGLDRSTTQLAPQRVFCTVPLTTGAQDVSMLQTQLLSCAGNNEQLSRAFAINNFAGSTSPIIVLEFLPFTASASQLKYECTLQIFSRRANAALQQPETELVNVTVPFFITPFDKALGAIEDEIDLAKDEASSGFYGLIGTLAGIFKWIKILCNILNVLRAINIAWGIFKASSDSLRTTVFGVPAAISACVAGTAAQTVTWPLIEKLQIVCTVASCGDATAGWSNWYTQWQKAVLDWYNTFTLRTAFGQAAKATSLSDNIFTSVAGLCIPGVILNLEELRQVKCRYVSCLENEVKSGVATVEACRELRDYQECKYFWGEVFQFLPIFGALDQLLSILKSMLTDPIGLIRVAFILGCSVIWCPTSGTADTVCDWAAAIFALTDIIEGIIGAFNQVKVTTQADYCSLVLE